MTEQVPFSADEFAENPEPRLPCLLLLDVSGSMAGQPISELNAGLNAFRDELAADSLASKRVEVGIVTFGPVNVEMPFQIASAFFPPILTPQGDTPMGAAIMQGLDLIRQRKDDYRVKGIKYYRPWMFMITDGAPTDSWQSAAAAIREGEESKSFAFFPIGVRGANVSILQQLSVREPLMLEGLRFRELFCWLSGSLRRGSQSALGSEIQLQSPRGWASI